jgi:transmembrane sensor
VNPDLPPSATGASASEAAAWWLIRLAEDSGEETRARFAHWYAGHADHSRAFDALAETQELARRTAGTDEMRALRQEALDAARRSRRRYPVRASIGAAAFAAAAACFFFYLPIRRLPLPPLPAYATGPHERLAVTLSDGSIVTLDASSRVRVAYSGSERRVILESGQALFEVAKGQPTPFSVLSGDHVVVAHGTIFDVWRSPGGVRVVLVRGAVGVDGGAGPGTMMKPDDVYEDMGAGPTLIHGQDSARFILWRHGIIQFRNERLADAVAEVNRYLDRPVALSPTSLGDLRISGTFHAGDQLAFTSAISGYFGLTVRQSTTAIILAGP